MFAESNSLCYYLADIMNDIDIMILTLSSSSVNVVFNASILRYMAQYMNAYIIWLYCAALNWKDFIYSKLTIYYKLEND